MSCTRRWHEDAAFVRTVIGRQLEKQAVQPQVCSHHHPRSLTFDCNEQDGDDLDDAGAEWHSLQRFRTIQHEQKHAASVPVRESRQASVEMAAFSQAPQQQQQQQQQKRVSVVVESALPMSAQQPSSYPSSRGTVVVQPSRSSAVDGTQSQHAQSGQRERSRAATVATSQQTQTYATPSVSISHARVSQVVPLVELEQYEPRERIIVIE